MLYHYIKSAFRSLWKNKIFTGINILGLAVSFSIAIVIYLIVDYHFRFDNFHEDKDRIFRVTTISYFTDQEFPNPGVPVPLSEIIELDISEIEQSVFFHRFWSNEVTIINPNRENVVFSEKHSNNIFTDGEYFNLFQYKWLAGSKESLNEPNKLVLTDKLATKYFGETPYGNILGRQIRFDNRSPYEVSGIVKSFDLPTEIIFSSFISFTTLESSDSDFYNDWDGVNSNDQLFVKLSKGTSPETVIKQIPEIEKKHSKAEASSNRSYELQAIEDIHFNPKYGNFKQPRGHKPTLYVLIIITFLLLLLSCINFINLNTALAGNRSKELNVRKTLGSRRGQLTFHLVIETFIVVISAALLALAFLPFIFEVFADFIPSEISPNAILEWDKLIVFALLIIIVAIISGSFPILSISKHLQTGLAKGHFYSRKETSKQYGYKALTVFQFSVSILIIVTTLSIQKQILYSLNKDLGYQTEAIINFRVPEKKKEVLLNRGGKIPGVQSISLGGNPPASGSTASSTFDFDYEGNKYEIHTDYKHGDSSFISVYDIQLLYGRNLASNDSLECLINQAFLKKIKAGNPSEIIGQYIGDKKIVGVVGDFHMKSTYMPINPVIIVSQKSNFNTFHVKLSGENVFSWDETIKEIEAAWNEISVEKDFHYEFYDDQIAAFYSTEKSMVKLLTWVSGITIFISCLGLLGIAVFTINRRIKEIGIRKVNGAKITEILILLNKAFVKWVVIALFIATPIAWFLMNKWLEFFAYKTELSWWIFALAGIVTLGIALLTVSWQSWKAATRNPVEALRYE